MSPSTWPDDPNQRQRPDPRKSRDFNPRNPMDRRDPPPSGGGGGSEETGCAFWLVGLVMLVAAILGVIL